jgi:hypothetical protein
MATTAAPKQQKKRSPAGCTTTPHVSTNLREMEALTSDLCEQVELIEGLCRTLGVFAYADENLEGLSVKDIGNTALLMGQTLDGVHEGLEKIEDLASSAAHATTAA